MHDLLKKIERYWIPEIIIVVIILLLLTFFTFGNPFDNKDKKIADNMIVPAEKAAGISEETTTTTVSSGSIPTSSTTTLLLRVGEVKLKESSPRDVPPASSPLVGTIGSKSQNWTYMGLKGFNVFGVAQGGNSPLYALSFKYGIYRLSGNTFRHSSSGISDDSNNLALSMSKSAPARMYLGTKLTGVFKTTNGARSWSSAGLTGNDIKNFAVSPTDPLTAFAGSEIGLYKTTNGGTSWKLVGKNNYPVSAVAVDPGNSSTIYYAAYSDTGIIYKSTDGGASWSTFGPRTYIWQIAINPQDSNNVFLGTDGGFYWTQDGGLNFNSTTIGSNSRINNVAINPTDPNTIYVSTIGSTGGWDTNGNIFRSRDGGNSWKTLNKGMPPTYVRQLFISPGNNKLIYGAFDDNGLYYYLDN